MYCSTEIGKHKYTLLVSLSRFIFDTWIPKYSTVKAKALTLGYYLLILAALVAVLGAAWVVYQCLLFRGDIIGVLQEIYQRQYESGFIRQVREWLDSFHEFADWVTKEGHCDMQGFEL